MKEVNPNEEDEKQEEKKKEKLTNRPKHRPNLHKTNAESLLSVRGNQLFVLGDYTHRHSGLYLKGKKNIPGGGRSQNVFFVGFL